MKKHFLIIIFCFSFLVFKTQNITSFSVHPKKTRAYNFYFPSMPIIKSFNVSPNCIFIKTQLQKLPFFCNMEDKFRNKYKVFLKIRAGNDESYMKMIKNYN